MNLDCKRPSTDMKLDFKVMMKYMIINIIENNNLLYSAFT